jgi:hypothetical protein
MKPLGSWDFSFWFGILLSAFLTVGCGGGGGGGKKTGTGTITSAGGTITSKDGLVKLVFPPGAVADDTPVTIALIDPTDLPLEFAEMAADSAYELSPSGIEFLMPITVTVKIPGKPVQGDGSLLSPLPPLMITSASGELEFLDDLTIHANADTNSLEATGQLGHFSNVMIKHPVRIDTEEQVEVEVITVKVAGVPDSHPVGFENPFTASVQVDHNAENEPELTGDYNSFPASPIANNHESPLSIYGTPNPFPYVCTEPGTGTYRSTVVLIEEDGGIPLFLFYSLPEGAVLPPAFLTAEFEKSVECTDPGVGNGGGGTTFPDLSLDVVGHFDFQSVACNLTFFDFNDFSYHITILGGTITITQGSTGDISVGTIDVNGNFTATQTGGMGQLIELYENGVCIADPFSCTAEYTYITTDPQTGDPCDVFYISDFEPIF